MFPSNKSIFSSATEVAIFFREHFWTYLDFFGLFPTLFDFFRLYSTQPAKDSSFETEKQPKTQRTKLAQKSFNNYLGDGRKRITTGINVFQRRTTGKNINQREKTQPANKTNAEPKKQTKTS